ncbi:MAG: ABC transporter substrate binding protein [Desulfuromonadales bacterium]
MRFNFPSVPLAATLLFILLCAPAPAATREFADTPTLNQGNKWRIGYIEGGPYSSYQQTLIAMVTGLMKLGWMEEAAIPALDQPDDTTQLWRWLAAPDRSRYLEFVGDAHYSSGWDEGRRKETRAKLVSRLNGGKDIDLVLALGTWAGKDMAQNDHATPTIVGSTTDALEAGIIRSVADSGFDHIHAKVEPNRHARQVQLFHDIFGFSRLGVAYEDTPDGRSFGAIDEVESIARVGGFQIVPCNATYKDRSTAEAEAAIARCYQDLAPRVDAVYLARHPGVTVTNMPNIIAPLIARKIPSFAQGLSEEVKHGVLLSVSLAEFRYLGRFYAQTIAHVFNGAKPRQLSQEYRSPLKIALNLKTAQLIGYNPSVDILSAADEIYQEIASPPKPSAKK